MAHEAFAIQILFNSIRRSFVRLKRYLRAAFILYQIVFGCFVFGRRWGIRAFGKLFVAQLAQNNGIRWHQLHQIIFSRDEDGEMAGALGIGARIWWCTVDEGCEWLKKWICRTRMLVRLETLMRQIRFNHRLIKNCRILFHAPIQLWIQITFDLFFSANDSCVCPLGEWISRSTNEIKFRSMWIWISNAIVRFLLCVSIKMGARHGEQRKTRNLFCFLSAVCTVLPSINLFIGFGSVERRAKRIQCAWKSSK